MDVTTKATPRLMLPWNVALGDNLKIIASKIRDVCDYYANIYGFVV